jgi:hypothetical protein
MPYDPDSPPDVVRNLPKKKQRQWCSVWNSCREKGQPEKQCFQTAWGVVKKSSCNCEIVGPTETEGSLADAIQNKDILEATDRVVAEDLRRIARDLDHA